MNHCCILVTISRNSICFRYNRTDGDNRFVDFVQDGEAVLPFAIECAGSEFVIGRSALEAATKNLGTNAFANIFETCKERRTFLLAGQDEPVNRLASYAIRHYIGKILTDSLYGVFGTLDENVATLPLMFLFTPEIDTDQRLLITDPFYKFGYQNVCSISYSQLLLPTLTASLAVNKRAPVTVVACVDGNDLLLHIYDTQSKRTIGDAVRIDGLGSDPRLKQVTNVIWSRLYAYNYQPREPEEDLLKEEALKFINSNERSVNSSMLMSDGSKQDYYLSRSELSTSGADEARRQVTYHLENALGKYNMKLQQCQVILTGTAATDYFESIFNAMPQFAPVKMVREKEKELMLNHLLEMVKGAGYKVAKLFPGEGHATGEHIDTTVETDGGPKLPPLPPKPAHTAPPLPPPLPPIIPKPIEVPSPQLTQLKREFRVRLSEIRGKLRVGLTESAQSAIGALNEWCDKNGYTPDNDQMEELRGMEEQAKVPVQPEPPMPPVPEPQPTVDKRAIRIKLSNIKGLARAGKKAEALLSLTKLEQELHRDNITEFDDKIIAIKKEFALNESPKKPISEKKDSPKQATKKPEPKKPEPKVAPTQPKVKSEGELMLQKGEFRKAKKIFAEREKNSEMAQVCSELIRAQRDIDQYTSSFDSVKRSKNDVSKAAAIKRLEVCKALYAKHGLDTAAIGRLIDKYKNI